MTNVIDITNIEVEPIPTREIVEAEEKLSFVIGYRFTGTSNITNRDGSVNLNLKNFIDLNFINEDKNARIIRIRRNDSDLYLSLIK